MTEDKLLVNKVLKGDHRAFKVLIEQHERLVAHMIYRIVDNSEDREEICQDVFLKVHKNLKNFKFNAKLSTWIATIAYRHALNYLQRKKKHIHIEGRDDILSLNSVNFIDTITPEYLLNRQETKKKIHVLVDMLPVQYKTILTLFHLEEMTYPEIVKITGMPEGTVKNYLFRARKLLKENLEKLILKEETI